MAGRALILVFLLGVVGCGGDDGEDALEGVTSNGTSAGVTSNGATTGTSGTSGTTGGGETTAGDPTLTGLTPLPEPIRRTGGDPEAGWLYLSEGGYVGSGIPYDVFTMFFGESANLLGRSGDNATLSPSFNAFTAPNGVRVVGGLTCFGCHASYLNGGFMPGLGSAFSDFSSQRGGFGLLQGVVESTYGADSPEAEISAVFTRGAEAVEPYIATPFPGVNPAFRLEEAAAAHRKPDDLTWLDEPQYTIAPGSMLASDVPPLWNVRKKNALYYNGMGRGDLARLIQQVMVVAIIDSEQAAEIDTHGADILAWLESLEPPTWSGPPIDDALAQEGEAVFEAHCASCHGTYGAEESYPNLLVPLEMVGTDPAYAEFFALESALTDWYNASWFAAGSSVEPKLGYVAPPLDGVWATAPYLHNASVPTLAALLDSSLRPAAWLRDFSSSAYDLERVGWPYEETDEEGAYDTTLVGFGNGGHTYGDALTDGERAALLEYLKTM